MIPSVAPSHPIAKAPADERAPRSTATRLKQAVLASLSVVALLSPIWASPAHAAFDLVPSRHPYVAPPSIPPATPIKPPLPTAAPDGAPAPHGGTAPDSAATASPGPVTPPKPASASTVTSTPLPPVGTGSVSPPATAGEASTIRGVARDLMLASVIRHIVPPAIAVTPMPAEIATRRVSYVGGGRPWREVLSEALSRANLTWREEAGTITITAATASPAVGTPTALAPAAPREPSPAPPSPSVAVTAHSAPGTAAAVPVAPSAPTRIAPPEPPPSPTPLASAAAPLTVTPQSQSADGENDEARPVSTTAQRASANAPAPLPFGAPPPASGYEAAKRTATWTVLPGDTVRAVVTRWATSIGLPVPNDASGYSWTLPYGATFRDMTYFEALEALTAGTEVRGVRADWSFSTLTLLTTIRRKNTQ